MKKIHYFFMKTILKGDDKMPRWKSSAIKTAIELHYPAEIIDKLFSASAKEDANRILITAREREIRSSMQIQGYIFTPHCRGVVRYTA